MLARVCSVDNQLSRPRRDAYRVRSNWCRPSREFANANLLAVVFEKRHTPSARVCTNHYILRDNYICITPPNVHNRMWVLCRLHRWSDGYPDRASAGHDQDVAADHEHQHYASRGQDRPPQSWCTLLYVVVRYRACVSGWRAHYPNVIQWWSNEPDCFPYWKTNTYRYLLFSLNISHTVYKYSSHLTVKSRRLWLLFLDWMCSSKNSKQFALTNEWTIFYWVTSSE